MNNNLKFFKGPLVWQKAVDLPALVHKIIGLIKSPNSKKAFTMIELMVSMTLFIILMSIATGSFIRTLRSQRAAVALMEVNENISFALEIISREIRTGYDFQVISASEFEFTNAKNQLVRYRLRNQAIEKGTMVGAAMNFQGITADNVRISRFNVVFSGESLTDNFQTRVTIALSAGANSPSQYLNFVFTNLQTTVSPRLLDSS